MYAACRSGHLLKENNVIHVAAGFSEQVYMYELSSLLCMVKKSVPFLVMRAYASFPAMFRTLLIPVTFPNANDSKLL